MNLLRSQTYSFFFQKCPSGQEGIWSAFHGLGGGLKAKLFDEGFKAPARWWFLVQDPFFGCNLYQKAQ